MRLADFILSSTEAILVEWETFARGIWPEGGRVDPTVLRDHAEQILHAAARDMQAEQTGAQQSSKSRGTGGRATAASNRLDRASVHHAVARVESGFSLTTMIAEYRALRASVLRLWRLSQLTPDSRDLEDLTRFNESIDQSLTEAVRSFTERLDRSRLMLLAILAHDLRNPLGAVRLSAEALGESAELAADDRVMIRQIISSADGMTRLVEQLLDFAGPGLGGTLRVVPEAADLGAIYREVVEEVRAAHPEREIRLVSAGDLAGWWDAGRLRQVVTNLLANALQHGAESSLVTLSVSGESADRIALAVHNEGEPIPAEALPGLFEPFARAGHAEPSKGRERGSIGLGLYIVRSIVGAHGGTIGVTSNAESGTTFSVELPRRV